MHKITIIVSKFLNDLTWSCNEHKYKYVLFKYTVICNKSIDSSDKKYRQQ